MRNHTKVTGFDIDYTLVEWLRRHGLLAAAPVLQRALTHLSVDEIVTAMDTLSMALLTSEDVELRVETTRRVTDSFARHVRANAESGPAQECLWSQISKASLVLESHGIDPAQHYKTLVDAEHAFWEGVGANSSLYDDARDSLRALREAGCIVFGVTSSDARVALHRGTSSRPLPHPYYSAPIARAKKLQRFKTSGLFDILPQSDIVVCDPFHKEDLQLWERRVFPRFREHTDRSRWAFVGDSRYDMVAADNAGIGERIFVNRHKIEPPVQATHVVNSLAEAVAVILRLP